MDSQSIDLPVDVVERVLSFLPIPAICRMRLVCKAWNECTNNATFHVLRDENGKNEDYLFLWRKDNISATGHKIITSRCMEAFHFFDLDMERWYSIPSFQFLKISGGDSDGAMNQWFRSMDDGLVCEGFPFQGPDERNLSLSLVDPVARTRRGLPIPNLVCLPPRYGDTNPSLVTVVDQVTPGYKVFLFNIWKEMPLVYVHESRTEEWRPVRGLPHLMDDAIAFQNTVFASQHRDASSEHLFQIRLFRYHEEDDSFTKVWHLHFQRKVVYSKLIVRHHRLFVLVITELPRSILLSDSEDDESEPVLDPCFQTFQDEEGALFEMYEILPDEGRSKAVVQFTEGALENIFGADDICTSFWFAFPCFDSKGGYSSVVLMHHHSGEMRRCHLATGAADVLPASPLAMGIPDTEGITFTFDAKTMPLSLRDVLMRTMALTGVITIIL